MTFVGAIVNPLTAVRDRSEMARRQGGPRADQQRAQVSAGTSAIRHSDSGNRRQQD
jgi:hypothetical protein